MITRNTLLHKFTYVLASWYATGTDNRTPPWAYVWNRGLRTSTRGVFVPLLPPVYPSKHPLAEARAFHRTTCLLRLQSQPKLDAIDAPPFSVRQEVDLSDYVCLTSIIFWHNIGPLINSWREWLRGIKVISSEFYFDEICLLKFI